MAHKNSHSAPRKKGGALKIVLVLLVLLLVVAGGGVWMAKREIDGGTPGEEVTVSIQQGSGVGTIANALKEAGVIRSRALFRWYVGQKGAAGKIAAVWRFYACNRQLLRCPDRGAVDYAKAESGPSDLPGGYTAIAIAQKMEDAGCARRMISLKEPTPAISANTLLAVCPWNDPGCRTA